MARVIVPKKKKKTTIDEKMADYKPHPMDCTPSIEITPKGEYLWRRVPARKGLR